MVLAPGQLMNYERSILFVGNFLTPSGIKVRGVSEDVAERLAALGWSVLTTSGQVSAPRRLADMVATVWRRRADYSVAHVDVFSGRAFVWAEAVGWTLRRAGKPFALTLHGGNLPSFARRWPRRVRALLRAAAIVTAPSRYLLEAMRAYRDDLHLLPNPIDAGAYPFRPRAVPRPHLVWLRSFHRIYNPELAPAVVARLAADYPDVRLSMIGPDKGDGSLERTQCAAEALGVADRVVMPGGVAKRTVAAWLNTGDIFLNTTDVDNTPISVLEAMACGPCVVSTSVGGIPYLLNHEHDALLVSPGDASAMASAVRRLLEEPGLAGRLSRNARGRIESFDWSAILPRWDTLFENLIARLRSRCSV